MPQLPTRSFRLKESQFLILQKEPYNKRASHLVRSLLAIFLEGENPGVAIHKLRQQIKNEAKVEESI
jgi:hypothetical protein